MADSDSDDDIMRLARTSGALNNSKGIKAKTIEIRHQSASIKKKEMEEREREIQAYISRKKDEKVAKMVFDSNESNKAMLEITMNGINAKEGNMSWRPIVDLHSLILYLVC